MEECWDHDAEARLSAGCVEQRIIGMRRNRQNDLIIQTPHIANLSDGVGYQTTHAMVGHGFQYLDCQFAHCTTSARCKDYVPLHHVPAEVLSL